MRGLRNIYRHAGIGAVLVGRGDPTEQNVSNRWLPPNAKAPVTTVIRFDDARLGMSTGKIGGTPTLYDDTEVSSIRIGPYHVPLESDPSVALAYRLEGSPLWDFEIAGFQRGDFSFLGVGPDRNTGGLYMLHPYLPGLIPVVFVHGTLSSPARWAQMVNELLSDRRLASTYQFWFFIYNSGNPIALSAMRLREALQSARKGVDPDGRDPALDQMVVIGHSQGGLLAKMTVVNSGTKFWDKLAKVPFDQAKLDPDTRDLLARALFVKPLPFRQARGLHRDATPRQLPGR